MDNRYDYQPSPLKFFGQDDPDFQEDDYFNNKPSSTKQSNTEQQNNFGNDRYAQQNTSYQQYNFGNDRYAQQNNGYQQNSFGNDRYAQQNNGYQQNSFGNDRYAQQNNGYQQNSFGNDRYAQQNNGYQQNSFGNDRYAQQNNSYQQNSFGNDRYAQQNTSYQQNNFGNARYDEPNNYQDDFPTENIVYGKQEDDIIRIGPQTGPAAKIFGCVFVLYFLASMAGMLIFSKSNLGLTLILFGQLFFVFGGVAFIGSKNKSKDLVLLVFPLIGAIVMAVGAINLFGDQALIDKLTEYSPVLITAAFFIAGLCIVLGTVISEIAAQKRCTVPVQGVVVDIKSKRSSGKSHNRVYSPVYEYYYEGKTYQQWSDSYSNVGVPRIGDEKTIYINPNKPTDFYVKNFAEKTFIIIFGLIFMGVGLMAFISSLTSM